MDVGITVYVNHALSPSQYFADYDYRFARVKAAINDTRGVVLIWSEGSYPVAAVIFIASIMVPTLKMIAIAAMLGRQRARQTRQ